MFGLGKHASFVLKAQYEFNFNKGCDFFLEGKICIVDLMISPQIEPKCVCYL